MQAMGKGSRGTSLIHLPRVNVLEQQVVGQPPIDVPSLLTAKITSVMSSLSNRYKT